MNEAIKVYGFVALCGLAIIGAGGWVHYHNEPPMPPPPAIQPKPEAKAPVDAMRTTRRFYEALVQEDATRFGVGASVVDLAQPFPYFNELKTAQRLVGKDSLTTRHLEIRASVEKQWANTGGGEGFGTDQFLLTIRNRTPYYLVYRVETEVPDSKRCRSAGATPHNAIGLRPHEQVTRTECIWGRGFFALVDKVEVMQVPALSYYYASQLHPPQVLYQKRTSEGHQSPTGRLCELVPWREIAAASESDEIGWADIIDYYARHNCTQYSYPRGYKKRTNTTDPLPAVVSNSAAAER